MHVTKREATRYTPGFVAGLPFPGVAFLPPPPTTQTGSHTLDLTRGLSIKVYLTLGTPAAISEYKSRDKTDTEMFENATADHYPLDPFLFVVSEEISRTRSVL
ncbi:hypothetical protein E2C01_011799 [Portunus trituberculatus]|uniref:Uncharacterized protein n=1 Tax=Portunus trituberculatus TaxID=210409 RepID=A0A5B7DC45_PORTR|nr:hypothetical protein [Portunus trituberculatus]